jgi:hypothetical protein
MEIVMDGVLGFLILSAGSTDSAGRLTGFYANSSGALAGQSRLAKAMMDSITVAYIRHRAAKPIRAGNMR